LARSKPEAFCSRPRELSAITSCVNPIFSALVRSFDAIGTSRCLCRFAVVMEIKKVCMKYLQSKLECAILLAFVHAAPNDDFLSSCHNKKSFLRFTFTLSYVLLFVVLLRFCVTWGRFAAA
jgi:hypothetical protein